MTPFRQLLRIFRDRFRENDAVSPGAGFETGIHFLLGYLSVPGLFVAMYLVPRFMELSFYTPGPAVDWELRSERLFFAAYSFAAVGFATVFEWDMLFPDRRDFLILAPFPIRLRDLFGAKVAALGLFLLAIVAAVGLWPVTLIPIFSACIRSARAAGVLRLMLAQVANIGLAAAFAFFLVAALQGLLINLTSPRFFRRISPWVQMIGMSVMVLSILLFPIYSMAMRPLAQAHPEWLRIFPPYWFVGICEMTLPDPDPVLVSLGVFGLKALAAAISLFCVTWATGFRRHYRRTLESDETLTQKTSVRLSPVFEFLLRSPEERGIFCFSGQMLGRSTKHRLFLATYWSAGVALGLLVMIVFKGGRPGISPDGLRGFPLLVTFFVISGFRGSFQFPAEPAANWLFQLSESGWGEMARLAARKRVLVSGPIPIVLLFMPLEITAWGWSAGLFHSVFQLIAGALLVEVFFWRFDKVPFTCSWFAGAADLAYLAGLHLFGFTTYSFTMADLEKRLESEPSMAGLLFAVAAILLVLAWRRRGAVAPVRFEAGDPEIQTLDLT